MANKLIPYDLTPAVFDGPVDRLLHLGSIGAARIPMMWFPRLKVYRRGPAWLLPLSTDDYFSFPLIRTWRPFVDTVEFRMRERFGYAWPVDPV